MPEFERKTYICGWITEIYPVDQYGKRMPREAPSYARLWPTREEALEDRARVAKPHPYVADRWIGETSYDEAGVSYREIPENHPSLADLIPASPDADPSERPGNG